MAMQRILVTCALGASLVGGAAAAASIDLSKDLHARGAKPAWSLTISNGTKLTLNRPGKPALVAVAPGAAISPQGTSLSGKTAKGEAVNANLTARACTLAGQSYPMTAEVTVGAETLTGCAGPNP